MGLSTKQVINSISTSNHVFDWSQTLLPTQPLQLPKSSPMRKHQEQQEQNHQQNSEQLKCPRCDSTNTKFCYYNNHNKSQPRHFCRSCKRHWTKGGTLRNVPIGGVRKNKNRNKKKSTSSAMNSKNQTNGNIGNKLSAPMTFQAHKQKHRFSLDFNDEKSESEVLYQSSLLPQQNNLIITSEPFTQNQMTHFPNFHSSNSFDSSNDLCSVSTSLIQSSSSSFYNYVEEFEVMTEPAISRHVPTTTISLTQQPWQVPITSNSGMDMSNNWSCDDIDTLVSNDINLVWDYSHIKS